MAPHCNINGDMFPLSLSAPVSTCVRGWQSVIRYLGMHQNIFRPTTAFLSGHLRKYFISASDLFFTIVLCT